MTDTMKNNITPRITAVAIALVIAGAVDGANAQSYQAEPLYPYVVQRQYYNAYPAQHPRVLPATPRARARALPAPRKKRSTKVDPGLVKELRIRGHRGERGLVRAKPIIVRDAPRVIVNRRVVDDPPRVIQRHYEVDDNNNVISTDPPQPAPVYVPSRVRQGAAYPPAAQLGPARVIHAEAEVTILGPDRMNIRLYRKGKGGANGRPN